MDVTVAQLLGSQDNVLPLLPVAPKYVRGLPLVSEEKLPQLPTHMRNLHEWYMRVADSDLTYIEAKVPEAYYFRKEEIHVELSELFMLFNFDALDKSLMSCYCL